MDNTKPITIHLYQCSSLHEGMNPQTILNAELQEYDRFTADNLEELGEKWGAHANRPRTCYIAENDETILCGGIGGYAECRMAISQHQF